MATESDLTAAGFLLPRGDDAVQNGDDVIRANAAAAYDHANNAATLKAANAISLTRITPRGDGTAVDGYGTEVGLLSDGSPAAWFTDYIARLFPIGDTPPAEKSINGRPVVWIDTRDRTAWKAAPGIIDDKRKVIVIPADEGATYTLNGIEMAAGEYLRPTTGEPVEYVITARAKEGYQLAGPMVWRGYITAGWQLRFSDSLSSGAWANGREAGPYAWGEITTSPTTSLSSSGLTNATHNGNTIGIVRFSDRKIAQRMSATYSLTSVGGSVPALSLYLGVRTTKYGEHTQLFSVSINSNGVLAFGGIGTDAFSDAAGTLTGHPSTGLITVEAMGDAVAVFINNSQVATATLPGTVTAHATGLRASNNQATVKNFVYEVK